MKLPPMRIFPSALHRGGVNKITHHTGIESLFHFASFSTLASRFVSAVGGLGTGRQLREIAARQNISYVCAASKDGIIRVGIERKGDEERPSCWMGEAI